MNNKEIIKQLSIKYKKDVRVTDIITRHPFKFLYELMQSESEKAFRIKYFGIFAMKSTKMHKGWKILYLGEY